MITRRAAAAGLAAALIGTGGRRAAAQAPSPSPIVDGLKGNSPRWVVTAKPTSVRLRADAAKEADLWTLGNEPAPAFRLKHGDDVRLSLTNGTSLPLSLHFHGVRGPNAQDGVGGLTEPPVPSGGSRDIDFTPPDAGTFLVRPCIPGTSAQPLERGLSALLIVEEKEPPAVDADLPLLIDDWRLAEDGTLEPFAAPGTEGPAGRLGNLLTVNGTAAPHRVSARPGSRIRLRFANACNARALRLRFDNLKATVIAVDGQPTEAFEPLRASLPLGPGNRYDLLVDVPDVPDGKSTVVAMLGQGLPLVEITTAGKPRSAKPDIRPLPRNEKLPRAIALEKATRKDLVIEASSDGQAPWTINGAAGDPAAPVVTVKRGSPVVLTLVNKTPYAQPFHLHGHVFRLLHALDDGWQPYFLDTVQVPENKTSRIAFVADNPGKWLLESMVMERFDAGLWTWIEVS